MISMVAIPHDPHATEKARVIFQSMAVVYGFFFILLSAFAGMTPEVRDMYIADSAIYSYGWFAAGTYYLLVLVSAMSMVLLGNGLIRSLKTMAVDESYRVGFVLLATALPLFYSIVIGFLVNLESGLIIFQTGIILALISWRGYALRKKR